MPGVDDPIENLYDYIGIHDSSNCRQILMSVYYSLTSLSTVDFGDFHPISNVERLYCSVILVDSVIIFSYIMGEFISMLEDTKF